MQQIDAPKLAASARPAQIEGMISRSSLALLVLGAVVAMPAAVSGKPKEAPACADVVRFTSDALLPLALVRGGAVAADQGQCPEEFFPSGQKWSAIDRFGKTVGTVATVSDDKGMRFRVVSGSHGAHLYVRGRKSTFASAAWTAPAGEREKVLHAIGAKLPRDVEFFRAGDKRFAIVVERSTFSIAELDAKGAWKRRYHQKTFTGFPVYAVRAIVDMNDDGMPEVIHHFSENAQGQGFEVVLARKPNGDWHEIASNEDTGP